MHLVVFCQVIRQRTLKRATVVGGALRPDLRKSPLTEHMRNTEVEDVNGGVPTSRDVARFSIPRCMNVCKTVHTEI